MDDTQIPLGTRGADRKVVLKSPVALIEQDVDYNDEAVCQTLGEAIMMDFERKGALMEQRKRKFIIAIASSLSFVVLLFILLGWIACFGALFVAVFLCFRSNPKVVQARVVEEDAENEENFPFLVRQDESEAV